MNKIKKIIKISQNFSILYAINNILISAFIHLTHKAPDILIRWRNTYIYNIIVKLAISSPSPQIISHIKKQEEDVIWTMWWQGEENAPTIVQQCIKSMRVYNKKVVILNQKNIEDYIGPIPERIKQLLQSEAMSMPNFSDYVRFTVLAIHGGVWLDSTIFCTKKLPEYCFSLPFYTFKQKNYINKANANAWWKAFILGSNKSTNIFNIARNIFISYWSTYDIALDYYLVDHILNYVFNLPQFTVDKNQIPQVSEDIYWLQKHASNKWKDTDRSKLCFVNKLDYKKIQTLTLSDSSVLQQVINYTKSI